MMEVNESDQMRHMKRMAQLFARLGPAKNAPIDSATPPDHVNMTPLVAYRDGDARAGWVLCMFRDEEDLQTAFNEVANAFPNGMELEVLEWRPGHRIQFVVIQSQSSCHDPLGQQGYIGAKWKTPLKPGQYIARGWKTVDGMPVCEDVVTTDEELPALRASGLYEEVTTPKGRP